MTRDRGDLAAVREEFRRQQGEAARLAPPVCVPTADAEKRLQQLEAERKGELQELRRLVEALRAMRRESAEPAAISWDGLTTRLGIPETKFPPEGALTVLKDPHDPEVLRLLEKLDDLVFAAITGPPEVVAELRSFWPQVRAVLDESLLIESREQYLRYALSLWEGSAGPEGTCQPERAVPSLDVLCLLFADN